MQEHGAFCWRGHGASKAAFFLVGKLLFELLNKSHERETSD
jgi:hypothetical protein